MTPLFDKHMDAAQRAKAMVIQLETLRDGERLKPSLQVLTRADCMAAREALAAASDVLSRPTWLAFNERVEGLQRWLTSRDMKR